LTSHCLPSPSRTRTQPRYERRSSTGEGGLTSVEQTRTETGSAGTTAKPSSSCLGHTPRDTTYVQRLLTEIPRPYRPAGHAEQAAAKAPEYSPARQSLHTPEPAAANLPAGQGTAVAEEEPAGQAYLQAGTATGVRGAGTMRSVTVARMCGGWGVGEAAKRQSNHSTPTCTH
jgi:hypothetical protein